MPQSSQVDALEADFYPIGVDLALILRHYSEIA